MLRSVITNRFPVALMWTQHIMEGYRLVPCTLVIGGLGTDLPMEEFNLPITYLPTFPLSVVSSHRFPVLEGRQVNIPACQVPHVLPAFFPAFVLWTPTMPMVLQGRGFSSFCLLSVPCVPPAMCLLP